MHKVFPIDRKYYKQIGRKTDVNEIYNVVSNCIEFSAAEHFLKTQNAFFFFLPYDILFPLYHALN